MCQINTNSELDIYMSIAGNALDSGHVAALIECQDATGANWTQGYCDIPYDTQWHLYTVVLTNSTTFAQYIDGQKITTQVQSGGSGAPSTSAYSALNATEIGGVSYNSTSTCCGFTGALQDARIYNVPLSAAQVKQLYLWRGDGPFQNYLTDQNPSATNLTAHGILIANDGVTSYATNRNTYNANSVGCTNTNGMAFVFNVTASSATIVQFDAAGNPWATNSSLSATFPILLGAGGFWTNSGTVAINGAHAFP